MMARSTKSSNQRPDTLMQDRTSAVSIKVLLQRTAGPYIWVISRHSIITEPCPLYPQKRTWSATTGMSALCQQRHLRSAADSSLFDQLASTRIRRTAVMEYPARLVRSFTPAGPPLPKPCPTFRFLPDEISQ